MKKKLATKFKRRNIDYHHTLTPDILKGLGFKKAKCKMLGNEVWRISLPYYSWQIQVELHDLPVTNPNCGVLSLYSPEEKADVSNGFGKPKYVTFKEQTIRVAHYVHTPERLHQLITVLTYQCA